MFEAAAGELRAKLVGAEKLMRNGGFPQRRLLTALRTTDSAARNPTAHTAVGNPHHRPHHKDPPHRLCSTDPGATTPTHSTLYALLPRDTPGVDTPRGRPGGRPLGVSHQHSASCPRRLLNNVSSALLGPLWPVPYSLVMTPTVGAQPCDNGKVS